MALDTAKFLARFSDEAREHCDRLNDGLLAMETGSHAPEILAGLFRSAHTIKGSARMLKLVGIGELAHRMEDLLEALRDGRLTPSGELTALLFHAVEALAGMAAAARTGAQPEAPEALCAALVAAGTPEGKVQTPQPLLPVVPEDPGEAPTAPEADYLRVQSDKLDDLIRLMGEIVSAHGRFRSEVGRLGEAEHALSRHLGRSEASQPLHKAVLEVVSAFALQEHQMAELQEATLRMRMLPLSMAFDPLRMTVHDLAREAGKEVDLVVAGGETELDRKIIEGLGDAFVHMIRNALDHGLETPEERIRLGKPPRGSIVLSAFYESGCVTIAMKDDGRGISLQKIREKALAKHLHDADTLAKMSRAELLSILFRPGFSTSPIITELSGRGVGMDVVRRTIVDELKGSVAIETEEGLSTTILLRLPMNLAIFPLFFVSVQGRVCALMATSLVEVLAVPRSEIIRIVDRQALRLRNQLIPVEDLAGLVGLEASEPGDEVKLAIVRDGEERLALIVEDLLGREERVVKPMPGNVKAIRLVCGATLEESNRVVCVLHAPELIRASTQRAGAQHLEGPAETKARVLVVDDSVNTRDIEKGILEASGYRVEMAEDGEEALGMAAEHTFDLVITDVEMPRMDGFTLTERLRRMPAYQEVPVIIVTSREKEEDKRRGIEAGADAYIVKGAFDQSRLLETVRSLIG
jgi:two-component system, chemotaxis family, sensor kinase CheA